MNKFSKNAAEELALEKRSGLMKVISIYGLPIMVFIMFIIFSALNFSFFSLSSLINIAQQNAALAIVAVGITNAIISRNIDLSPGSMIALTGIVVGLVYTSTGNLFLGFMLGLLVAVIGGLFNGFLVAVLNINPVIVTLSAMIWARGLALALTEGDSIIIRHSFIDAFNRGFIDIPFSVVLVIPIYFIGWFLLNKTRIGRYTYALGGDEEAARDSGVNTQIFKIIIFSFTGLMTGIASIVSVCRVATAQPIFAIGLELDAIIAVVIGGNSLAGGEGGIGKTIMGVIFIAILSNGLSSLGLTDNYYFSIKGSIILLALLVEVVARRAVVEEK
jgi:ribose/xylose/arabinose/galactoside ABC-type transport system permease subunit